jgi:predicted SnoaL-like aldol condensation-catalyzing enzyme
MGSSLNLRTFIDDTYYGLVKTDMTTSTNIFVKENHAKLYDNLIQTGPPEEKNFYSVDSSKTRFDEIDSKERLIRFYIRMDKKKVNYERRYVKNS